MTTSNNMDMNSKSCILLSHVFIRSDETYKLDLVNFSVKHCRRNNPDAYIILTGHGLVPDEALSYCDYTYWQQEIVEKDLNVGHPHLVNIGLNHAIENGFDYVCKSRSDGVHLIQNLLDFSHSKLEDKKLLITQQTKFHTMHMGDLFMYGKVDFLKECWNMKTWYPTETGLTSLANNFLSACLEDEWVDALRNNCSFIDIYNLKWIDFRANWNALKDLKEELLENSLQDYENYLWGTTEGWHRFDSQGNLTCNNYLNVITEKTWV